MASITVGSLVVGGAFLAGQSGVRVASERDDEGRNRIGALLPKVAPTFTWTPLPTETPEPTFTPTPEPTEVPPTKVVIVQPTPRPVQVQPTAVSTREALRIPEGFDFTIAAQVIAYINDLRAKSGLSVLKTDSRLSVVSQAQVQKLLDNNFPLAYNDNSAHMLGGDPSTRAKQAGYPANWVGEVIAWSPWVPGADQAANIVGLWQSSAGHLAAILNSSHRDIGASCWTGARSTGLPAKLAVVICIAEPAY